MIALSSVIAGSLVVFWRFLPSSVYVLNIDKSALTNPSRSGFGGLLWDDMGQWMVGFSGFIGFSSNLHVEL